MAAVPDASEIGLGTALARLARSLLAHARMRLQLLGLEFEQERERLLMVALALLLSSVFLSVTLVLVILAVLVHFWDTPQRLAAVVWLAVGSASMTTLFTMFALQRLKRPSTLFQASLAELVDDEASFAAASSNHKSGSGDGAA